MLKRIIAAAIVAGALIAAAPAAANAAVFKTEDQAEQYMVDNYSDFYWEDEEAWLDDATCDGFGRVRDGGDGADDRYTKFQCESDYSYDDGDGFTDVDVLKARSWGFKIRSVDSYWW